MLTRFTKTLIPLAFGCALLGAGAVRAQAAPSAAPAVATAQADPSPQQVYAAARAGNFGEARQMIEQVLRDHPGSANAHYVAAEVYARSGDLGRARSELRTARSINPGLTFASPRSVAELEQQLGAGRVAYGASVRSHSISWGGVVLVVAAIAVIYALLRRRSAMAAPYQPYGQYPGQAGPYGSTPYPAQYPGAGPYGQPMGMGSGLMGNLATGLAVGAGVAAGEELVGHMLNSGAGGSVIPAANAGEPVEPPNADMGGNDFGLNDGSSWGDGGGGGFGGDSGGDMGGGDMGGGGDWT